MSSTDFERLYSMTIDDLYEELGKAIFAVEFPTAAPKPKLFALQRGKAFVATHTEKLKAKICVEWKYCDKRGDFGSIQALAYAVAPLVSNVIGVPAATAIIVAIILIKMGLDKFCNCLGT